MAKGFTSDEQVSEFLQEPRLAMLIYHGANPAPTGVPVWFDWNGDTLQLFAGRTSPKVRHIQNNPNISVLVTNRVGEPEAWVAFDGVAEIKDFEPEVWSDLLDRVAPRYWDMSNADYQQEIESWRSAPEAFVSLRFTPVVIRSGR